MKYEEPYMQIIQLQETVITLVSGSEGDDDYIDWGEMGFPATQVKKTPAQLALRRHNLWRYMQ